MTPPPPGGAHFFLHVFRVSEVLRAFDRLLIHTCSVTLSRINQTFNKQVQRSIKRAHACCASCRPQSIKHISKHGIVLSWLSRINRTYKQAWYNVYVCILYTYCCVMVSRINQSFKHMQGTRNCCTHIVCQCHPQSQSIERTTNKHGANVRTITHIDCVFCQIIMNGVQNESIEHGTTTYCNMIQRTHPFVCNSVFLNVVCRCLGNEKRFLPTIGPCLLLSTTYYIRLFFPLPPTAHQNLVQLHWTTLKSDSGVSYKEVKTRLVGCVHSTITAAKLHKTRFCY